MRKLYTTILLFGCLFVVGDATYQPNNIEIKSATRLDSLRHKSNDILGKIEIKCKKYELKPTSK